MGAKVQHKMYLSGHFFMRDLNDNASKGSWLSSHGNKAFGQYNGILSARPAIDGFTGYEWEQLRQTIMEHETIFRQQLQELHRLYKIQAEMMNAVRSREPNKHLKSIGTPQSSIFAITSADNKSRWNDSGLPLVDFSHHVSSPSNAYSIQSHLSSMNVKMQSGCGSTYNGSRYKEYESLDSRCKKLQRRLFDLELPADECINDEEEGQGASRISGVENFPPNGNCHIPCENNGYLSTHSVANSICNGDASSSNMNLRRNLGLTDLNEPVLVEEASSTASVDILGNVTCSREGIQKRDLSASSCSGFLAKETSQSPSKEKDEGVNLHNLNLENEIRQKGWLPYTSNLGQVTSNKSSQDGVFHCEYLHATCDMSQDQHQRADQNRREHSSKKTIFGVEISQRNQNHCAIRSGSHIPQPLVLDYNFYSSVSSSIPSWKILPAGWRQNLTSNNGNANCNAFPKPDNGSGRLLHGHEVAQDRSFVSNNVSSVPSLTAEPFCQRSPCLVSQMQSKESQVYHGSVGFCYLTGNSDSSFKQASQHSPTSNFRSLGWLGYSKSVAEANAVLPKSCKNEAIFDSKPNCVDDLKKEENPKGGLSWLRDSSCCNGEYCKERDGSYRVNLNFLQNQSQQFTVKAERMNGPSQSFISSLMKNSSACNDEERRSEVGGYTSNRKILGVPIFEKQISQDLPSLSSASKPISSLEVNGSNTIKDGLLLADLNLDPIPSESGEVQHSKTLVGKDGSFDCSANLRDHIDLNASVNEEESQPAHFSPRTKVKPALEIDLEAPVVLDSEMDITSGSEFSETIFKEPFDPLKDESGEFNEGFLKVAAETLIAISSSGTHNIEDGYTHAHLEVALSESLRWFAETIASYEVEIESHVVSVSVGKDRTNHGDSIPNGIDYFEYMTLNLTETKLEKYHYEPEVLENTKDDAIMPRRPRRGQGRRGRQRKDFQRDVLPGLVSLSRNDVTEDLQTIEGLVRATGGIWQSSLSQRSFLKSKRGRGRKCLTPAATTPTETAVSPPQIQQSKYWEMGPEETRLTGWGKRTRRPPRQRCLSNQPPFQLQ